MSRRISFTRAERDAVAAGQLALDGAHRKALAALLAKMDEASQPAAPTAADFRAVGARRFVELARSILGQRVFLPPFPAPSFWSQLQATLTRQGVDERAAEIALEHVASWAKHPQDVTALARNASRYLHEATTRPTATPADAQEETDGYLGRPPELR